MERIESKILYGLERISEILRIFIWRESLKHQINPTQYSILLSLHFRKELDIKELIKITKLDKTTISKSIKNLYSKELILIKISEEDKRSKKLLITEKGKNIIQEIQKKFRIFEEFIKKNKKKDIVYEFIYQFIFFSLQNKWIESQRMCFQCKFFQNQKNKFYCNYLKKNLEIIELQIDCKDFEKFKILS